MVRHSEAIALHINFKTIKSFESTGKLFENKHFVNIAPTKIGIGIVLQK